MRKAEWMGEKQRSFGIGHEENVEVKVKRWTAQRRERFHADWLLAH
jgi:hypothetical protein